MTDPVKAYPGKGLTTIYEFADGSREIRTGGHLSWRNNNPGNIMKGRVAEIHGAIGYNGKFAIFPSMTVGERAKEYNLERPEYLEKTLAEAMHRYAPPTENDTGRYIRFITKETGIESTKKLKDFTPQESRMFCDAIRKFEGVKEGSIKFEPGPVAGQGKPSDLFKEYFRMNPRPHDDIGRGMLRPMSLKIQSKDENHDLNPPIGQGSSDLGDLNEAGIRLLMRTDAYWNTHDPRHLETIETVINWFQRRYGMAFLERDATGRQIPTGSSRPDNPAPSKLGSIASLSRHGTTDGIVQVREHQRYGGRVQVASYSRAAPKPSR